MHSKLTRLAWTVMQSSYFRAKFKIYLVPGSIQPKTIRSSDSTHIAAQQSRRGNCHTAAASFAIITAIAAYTIFKRTGGLLRCGAGIGRLLCGVPLFMSAQCHLPNENPLVRLWSCRAQNQNKRGLSRVAMIAIPLAVRPTFQTITFGLESG